jgi:hypothetical protein
MLYHHGRIIALPVKHIVSTQLRIDTEIQKRKEDTSEIAVKRREMRHKKY